MSSRPHKVSTTPHKTDYFGKAAAWTIHFTGGRWGFLSAFGTVIVWAISGPYFHYSSDWQLVINTGTTIVTFLMVFLIQNAQNRESKAIHLKLDEVIFSIRSARNELIDVENMTDEQLERLTQRYRIVSEKCRENVDSEEFLNPKASPLEAHSRWTLDRRAAELRRGSQPVD